MFKINNIIPCKREDKKEEKSLSYKDKKNDEVKKGEHW